MKIKKYTPPPTPPLTAHANVDVRMGPPIGWIIASPLPAPPDVLKKLGVPVLEGYSGCYQEGTGRWKRWVPCTCKIIPADFAKALNSAAGRKAMRAHTSVVEAEKAAAAAEQAAKIAATKARAKELARTRKIFNEWLLRVRDLVPTVESDFIAVDGTRSIKVLRGTNWQTHEWRKFTMADSLESIREWYDGALQPPPKVVVVDPDRPVWSAIAASLNERGWLGDEHMVRLQELEVYYQTGRIFLRVRGKRVAEVRVSNLDDTASQVNSEIAKHCLDLCIAEVLSDKAVTA